MSKKALLAVSIVSALLGGCGHEEHAAHHEKLQFNVTHPIVQDTTLVKEYVSQIRAIQHIEVRAMEKGYLHWGHDITIEEDPYEAGVGFCVNLKKPKKFLGQEKLEEKLKKGSTKRRVNFSLHDKNVLLYHNEPIFYDGKAVGEITSGMYGHYLDKSLGMGYINFENKNKLESMLKEQKFEIEIAGLKYKADASLIAFYDSKREKILI